MTAIDLSVWKITLPTGKPESPSEYFGKDLDNLSNSEFFERLPDGSLRFRAPVNGVTTKGSKNPRSELREMNRDGSRAAWSSSVGAHTLVVEQAFTGHPKARNDGGMSGVVGAQIHDAKKDISVFRLEGTKLWVTKDNDTHFALADSSYLMGTRCVLKYVVYRDTVHAYYNDKLVVSIPFKFSGAYFKAGAYTQANSSNSKPNNSTNYGETIIYSLKVSHLKTPEESTQEPVPVPPVPAAPPVTCPSEPVPVPAPRRVIMIIRHAEKPEDEDNLNLSPKGRQRAAALVGYFMNPRRGVFKPDRLYASYKEKKSLRPVQTLDPLSKVIKLPINKRFEADDVGALLKEIRGKSGVTLVCWARTELVEIARELGRVTPKPPKSWPEDRFDVVWVFTENRDGWDFREVAQKLLPGDSTKGIGGGIMARLLSRLR